VSRPVVSICRAEERPRLGPAAHQRRVTAVVGQEAELVTGCPAETGAVGQEDFTVMVQRSGPFVDGSIHTLPVQGWFGEHFAGADRGGGVHGRDAHGLDASREAGPHKVIPVLDAEDGSIDAPVWGELTGIGVAIIPGMGTAYADLSVEEGGYTSSPVHTLQDVGTLAIQVLTVARRVVDVPPAKYSLNPGTRAVGEQDSTDAGMIRTCCRSCEARVPRYCSTAKGWHQSRQPGFLRSLGLQESSL
jgi:hypothetical protein